MPNDVILQVSNLISIIQKSKKTGDIDGSFWILFHLHRFSLRMRKRAL